MGTCHAIGFHICLSNGSLKREERQLCGTLGLRVNDFFEELTREKYGTTNCRDIAGCDFTKPEEARAYVGSPAQDGCAGLLVDTVRFVLPLLDDPKAGQ